MKECSHPDCHYPQWGGGYCKSHQHLRKDKSRASPKRKAIKPVSDKRKVQKAEYLELKEFCITEARKKGPIRCFACEKEIEGFVDWHHVDGREEDKLTDTANLVFMHRDHHDQIHHLDVDHLLQKPWYESIFLKNLKAYYPNLYERELQKRTKTSIGATTAE